MSIGIGATILGVCLFGPATLYLILDTLYEREMRLAKEKRRKKRKLKY